MSSWVKFRAQAVSPVAASPVIASFTSLKAAQAFCLSLADYALITAYVISGARLAPYDGEDEDVLWWETVEWWSLEDEQAALGFCEFGGGV